MGCMQTKPKNNRGNVQQDLRCRQTKLGPQGPQVESVAVENVAESEPTPPPSAQPHIKRKTSLKELFAQARKDKPSRFDSPHRDHIRYIGSSSPVNTPSSSFSSQSPSKNNQILQQIAQNADITTCPICLQPFNIGERLPMMVCMDQHTFCQKCISDSWKKGNHRCPLDQQPFDLKDIRKNRLILEIIGRTPEQTL